MTAKLPLFRRFPFSVGNYSSFCLSWLKSGKFDVVGAFYRKGYTMPHGNDKATFPVSGASVGTSSGVVRFVPVIPLFRGSVDIVRGGATLAPCAVSMIGYHTHPHQQPRFIPIVHTAQRE